MFFFFGFSKKIWFLRRRKWSFFYHVTRHNIFSERKIILSQIRSMEFYENIAHEEICILYSHIHCKIAIKCIGVDSMCVSYHMYKTIISKVIVQNHFRFTDMILFFPVPIAFILKQPPRIVTARYTKFHIFYTHEVAFILISVKT